MTVQILLQIRQDQLVPLFVDLNKPLGNVKLKIDNFYAIPPIQQLLVFAGKPLDDDDKLLSEYGIEENSKLFLVLRLRGCSDCEHCKNNKTE